MVGANQPNHDGSGLLWRSASLSHALGIPKLKNVDISQIHTVAVADQKVPAIRRQLGKRGGVSVLTAGLLDQRCDSKPSEVLLEAPVHVERRKLPSFPARWPSA